MVQIFIPFFVVSQLAIATNANGNEAKQLTSAQAGQSPVVGWLEKLELAIPNSQGKVQKAILEVKVDTGAETSSLHAVDLKIVRRKDQAIAQFQIVWGSRKLEAEAPLVKMGRVKSSDGNSEERPFVEVEICLGNKVERVLFSLNDRGNMRFPILLGRNFLARRFLVDAGKEFLMGSPTCRA